MSNVPFHLEDTEFEDVKIVVPKIFHDERGFFTEVFRADMFTELGLPGQFVQFNHSGSSKGTVRGLHFQWEPPMAKLMRVSVGEAFLVAVDIRKRSPTLGKWFGRLFSSEAKQMLWAPAGFARGFCVTADYAEIEYLTTGTYNPNCESGVLWSDPEIGIDWPTQDPILSAKDGKAQTLAEWLEKPESEHFKYGS